MSILTRGERLLLWKFITIPSKPPVFKKKNLCNSFLIFSGGGYSGNQENRYVGFGNTVTPEKKEDDFLNNAMSSIYTVFLFAKFKHGVVTSFLPDHVFFNRGGAVSLLAPASSPPLLKIM